jgi:hypothetical protein
MTYKTLFALSILGSLCATGCHGGGGGNTSSILPTITTNSGNCNPKADVHQRKAREILMRVRQFGYIPTRDEEEFAVCMIEEREDKAEFQAAVQKNKDQQRAAQEQEAEQRRQAEIEAHRPASPEEIQEHDEQCKSLVGGRTGDYATAFLDMCNKVWAANPHSRCGGDNLPCGNQCYCVNCGQTCREVSPGVLQVF